MGATGQLTREGKFIYPNAGPTVSKAPVGKSAITPVGDTAPLIPGGEFPADPPSKGALVDNGRLKYPHTDGKAAGNKDGGHIPEPGESKPSLAANQGAETKTTGSTAEEQRGKSVAEKFYPNTPTMRSRVAEANS